MQKVNPDVRIIGFTATPFRLGHGYIFGSDCRKENKNLFEKLHYAINITDLQKDGYLCQYRGKETVNINNDLSTVKVSGDDNIGDLSDLMIRELHLGSAVKAVQDYAQDRKRIVVFCVTIEHAEKVKQAFTYAGFPSACVHSQMSLGLRDMVLNSFEKGTVQVMCNVGVLTEGWDSRLSIASLCAGRPSRRRYSCRCVGVACAP